MTPGARKAAALAVGLGASVVALVGVAARAPAQSNGPEITVHGRKYAFSPAQISVHQNDLVKITFTADDIAHSFTIDQYRIAKRAGAGQSVVFEFRADQAGTFPFYCNLTEDAGCKNMHGELVVR